MCTDRVRQVYEIGECGTEENVMVYVAQKLEGWRMEVEKCYGR